MTNLYDYWSEAHHEVMIEVCPAVEVILFWAEYSKVNTIILLRIHIIMCDKNVDGLSSQSQANPSPSTSPTDLFSRRHGKNHVLKNGVSAKEERERVANEIQRWENLSDFRMRFDGLSQWDSMVLWEYVDSVTERSKGKTLLNLKTYDLHQLEDAR